MVVTLDSHEGALRTTLGATGDLVARAHVDNWVLDDTHITATASDLFVDATASFGGGGLAASVDDLTVDFSNFDLEIGSIPGWLPGLFVEAAKSVIGRVIKGRVGPIVTDVLASVGGDYPLTSVPCLELPEPFVLTYRLAAIAPKERRLGVRLGAEAHHGGSGGQGAPMRDEAGVAAPAGGPMAVGVGYNLLNQFLFELWRGGALKITLDEGDLAAALPSVPALAGLDVILDVKAELGLPPVVEAGEGGKLRVSVGEIRVDIKLDAGVFQIALAVNVGAVAAVELSIADGAPRVAVAIEELHFDLGRKTFSGLNPEAVRQLVAAIAPELVGRVAGALEAFKLPAVDLTQVGVAGVRIGIDSGTVRAAAGGVAFSGTDLRVDRPAGPQRRPRLRRPAELTSGQRAGQIGEGLALGADQQRGGDVDQPPFLDGADGDGEGAAVDAADHAEAAGELDLRRVVDLGKLGDVDLDQAVGAGEDQPAGQHAALEEQDVSEGRGEDRAPALERSEQRQLAVRQVVEVGLALPAGEQAGHGGDHVDEATVVERDRRGGGGGQPPAPRLVRVQPRNMSFAPLPFRNSAMARAISAPLPGCERRRSPFQRMP
jgi:hypothetical protein